MNKLTKPRGIIKELGPGWVMMALAQGSGELIWWPYLVGKYGLSFLWLLPVAAVMQYPINYLLGRHTFTTRQTFFNALFNMSKPIATIVWLLFAISFFWFGAYATAAGAALGSFVWPAALEASDKTRSLVWGSIILVLSLVVIIVKRNLYPSIEKFMRFICYSTVGLLILAVLLPQEVRGNYSAFLGGSFPYLTAGFWQLEWFPKTWDVHDWPILVSALLFTGLGGFWNLFYSYWTKEKKWGIDTSDNTREDNQSSQITEDEQKLRYRKWMKVLHVNTTIGVFGNLFTTTAITLLALTYLTKSAELPSGWRLVIVQSQMFSGLGPWGPSIFMCVAVLFLIDFWITVADGVAKVHVDALTAWFPALTKLVPHNLYMSIVYVLAVITSTSMFISSPQELFLINANINALAMVLVVVCILLLWKQTSANLPHWVSPSRLSNAALWLVLVFYLGGFVLYLMRG